MYIHMCVFVCAAKKPPINPMQEVSGAWRSRACSDVFVQLGIFIRPIAMPSLNNARHRLCAPFRQ